MIRIEYGLMILIVCLAAACVFFLGTAQEPQIKKVERTTVVKVKGGEGTYSHQVDVTAYSGEVRQTNSNPDRTAIMEQPIPGGTCAVSQDMVKYLGMRVYIKGLGVFRVNDLMNKRFTNRIDLFMASRSRAEDFGLKEDVQAVFFRSM